MNLTSLRSWSVFVVVVAVLSLAILCGPERMIHSGAERPLLGATSPADLEPIHARGASPATQALVRELFGNLPLYFVENRGQLDERVRYYVKGRDKTLYFTGDGVTMSIQGGDQRWAV